MSEAARGERAILPRYIHGGEGPTATLPITWLPTSTKYMYTCTSCSFSPISSFGNPLAKGPSPPIPKCWLCGAYGNSKQPHRARVMQAPVLTWRDMRQAVGRVDSAVVGIWCGGWKECLPVLFETCCGEAYARRPVSTTLHTCRVHKRVSQQSHIRHRIVQTSAAVGRT